MVVVVLREVQRSGDFVLGNQGLGVAKVPFWFPGVFSGRISLPSDQEGVMTGLPPMSKDCYMDCVIKSLAAHTQV